MKSSPWWYVFPGIILIIALSVFLGESFKTFAINIMEVNFMSFKQEEYHFIRYRLYKPNTYKISPNAKMLPLIVYLHGAAQRGSDNKLQLKGLKFLGSGFGVKALAFQRNYPSFVYVPQCAEGSEWDGPTVDGVIDTIEHLISIYPIDTKRLYLIGYSMGGSGVYELASRYHDVTGRYFAALIRVVGQASFESNVHEAVSKSAVWIHIGLRDTPLRIEKAREAYGILKKLLDGPSEHVKEFYVDGQRAKSYILTINGKEKVILTEYQDAGHGIYDLPFLIKNGLKWLFDQEMSSPKKN